MAVIAGRTGMAMGEKKDEPQRHRDTEKRKTEREERIE